MISFLVNPLRKCNSEGQTSRQVFKVVLLSFFLFTEALHAQSFTIKNVTKYNPRNVDAIHEHQKLIGYYALNSSAVPGTKNSSYELSILDTNLNVVSKGSFQKSKNTELLESAWNGNTFCFSFLDSKKRTLEYQLLSRSCQTIGHYQKELNPFEFNYYSDLLPQELEAKDNNLVALDSNLFVRYGVVFDEGQSFQAEAFTIDGKRLWEYTSITTYNSAIETFLPIFADKNILVIFLTEYESPESENVKYSTLILDAQTGAFKVKLPILVNGKKLIPLGCSPNTGKDTYYLFGNYFTSEKNIVTADADGFFIAEMTTQGKILKENIVSRIDKIEPSLKSLSNFEFQKNTKIYAHKIVKTSDNKLFVIGEAYSKKLNEKAVASYLLSGPYHGTTKSISKVELSDLLIFELDSLFQLKHVDCIKKDKTDIHYKQKMGLFDSNLLGAILKRQGKFDYCFVSQETGTKFNCLYLNRENGNSNPKNYIVGNITPSDESPIVTQRLNLKNDCHALALRKAKTGHVMVIRYYKGLSLVKLELRSFEIQ
jgi:hypothetical protein